jgi:hypothetical protein
MNLKIHYGLLKLWLTNNLLLALIDLTLFILFLLVDDDYVLILILLDGDYCFSFFSYFYYYYYYYYSTIFYTSLFSFSCFINEWYPCKKFYPSTLQNNCPFSILLLKHRWWIKCPHVILLRNALCLSLQAIH